MSYIKILCDSTPSSEDHPCYTKEDGQCSVGNVLVLKEPTRIAVNCRECYTLLPLYIHDQRRKVVVRHGCSSIQQPYNNNLQAKASSEGGIVHDSLGRATS